VHEMSIAASILDIAEEQAQAAEARVINTVEIEVGSLAGIEVDSLRFCWSAARHGLAAEAELVIREIEGRGFCLKCEREHPVDFHVALCPDCESGMEIRQGRELRILALNVD